MLFNVQGRCTNCETFDAWNKHVLTVAHITHEQKFKGQNQFLFITMPASVSCLYSSVAISVRCCVDVALEKEVGCKHNISLHLNDAFEKSITLLIPDG